MEYAITDKQRLDVAIEFSTDAKWVARYLTHGRLGIDEAIRTGAVSDSRRRFDLRPAGDLRRASNADAQVIE